LVLGYCTNVIRRQAVEKNERAPLVQVWRSTDGLARLRLTYPGWQVQEKEEQQTTRAY
jgi:hypothetical protein